MWHKLRGCVIFFHETHPHLAVKGTGYVFLVAELAYACNCSCFRAIIPFITFSLPPSPSPN